MYNKVYDFVEKQYLNRRSWFIIENIHICLFALTLLILPQQMTIFFVQMFEVVQTKTNLNNETIVHPKNHQTIAVILVNNLQH